MTTAKHLMGGDSVITNTLSVSFTDGTKQSTAADPAFRAQCGVAIFTGGSVSTVTFSTSYVAVAAPAVVCNPLDGAVSGEPSSVHILGGSGAWTGFSLTLSNNVFGAYNWISLGNPN